MASDTDPDVEIEALLRGYPSIDAVDRKLLAGAVVDAMDLAGLAGDELVAEYFDLFTRDKRARIVKELADLAGIPYSVARKVWSNPEDIAAEIGHRAVKSVEAWKRCPQCGLDHADVFDHRGRWLPFPRWKMKFRNCDIARILKSLNEDTKEGQWGLEPAGRGDEIQEGPNPFAGD